MSFVDVIARKRDGQALSRDDIDLFVQGVTSTAIPDYQASALLMAIVIRGMSEQETAWFTDALLRSGERVDLSDVPGIKVGKHSTGGVGDKVSIILAPVAAACGVVAPKMSGRSLGHTGGTLDKLESIPGFRTDLSIDQFKRVLRTVGTSIIGQSASLVPADKRIYALRDVTATVPSIPLIAASIMSKKLAEGGNALVLDVKCGHGAFMKAEADAITLARLMVALGSKAGVRTEAVITNMDVPLGRAVGNAVEVIECIQTLKGHGPDDLTAIVVVLATRVLVLSGLFAEHDAELAVRRALASGAALEKLRGMIEAHGGDARVIDDAALLPAATRRHAITVTCNGYVSALHAELLGRASMVLGAGRHRIDDRIDHGVGLLIAKRPGDLVCAGETVVELLCNSDRGLAEASALVESAIQVAPSPPVLKPLVLGRVE